MSEHFRSDITDDFVGVSVTCANRQTKRARLVLDRVMFEDDKSGDTLGLRAGYCTSITLSGGKFGKIRESFCMMMVLWVNV